MLSWSAPTINNDHTCQNPKTVLLLVLHMMGTIYRTALHLSTCRNATQRFRLKCHARNNSLSSILAIGLACHYLEPQNFTTNMRTRRLKDNFYSLLAFSLQKRFVFQQGRILFEPSSKHREVPFGKKSKDHKNEEIEAHTHTSQQKKQRIKGAIE